GTIMFTLVVTVWPPNRNSLTGRDRLRCCSTSSRVPKNRASLGQTVAHIGLRPVLVRSKHMSHFIIRSNSVTIFGTPNGHARTQFEHAMHRGLRAVITRPSALRLMASAGQTSAHVGLWQCMHTTGTVCTEVLRSTYSMWIIECPLCVSHSEHACSQAWHPMHR